MLLTIHDANLQKVAFIDNDKQSTLNYYDDTWTRNLETGSSTFEFTVFKKAIKSDTASHKTYNHLNEKAFVSFKHHGKSYVFSVMTVEENEQTIKCYCENLNLELINEYANPYKAAKAMSFVEYCNAMDLLNFTHLSVGINEISDQKRTLEWEGQDTKLARLLSLATKFDAEIDFDTELNSDSSIKSFKVNVYHEYDDKHQGVGRVRNDIQLTYGKNLKSIKRTVDKTGIYNAVRPTGKGKTKGTDGNEVETIVTIGSLSAWSENNADGVREFYQSGEMLYAPLSMQMYPSTFTSGTQSDQWIRKDIEVESDNPTVIRSAAIRNLKKNAYPALTYEVDGFIDVEIGDTIRIYDDGFTPILLIKARVSDQKISFTNPKSNRTTFANFKALKNNLSSGIQSAFERLFEAAKPYTIKLATDNGVIFKNQIGQSLVTPTLYKGGKPIVAGVTWRWSLNEEVTTGMTYLVKGSSVTDTVTLTVVAYIGNDEVAVDEISFVNVVDGKLGTPGTPGRDGLTPYLHIAYSASNNGSQGFSTTDSTNKTYIGTYTDYTQSDSQDYRVYKWTLIKGSDGNGIANITNYYLATVASTGITENSSGWTTTPQSMTEEKRYLWNYRVELYTNGTSKTTAPVIIGVHGSKGDKGGFSEEQLNEVNKKIDSKADQVLTQEQLNALNEKAQLLDAEMKAKASMEAFSELEKAYNAFVENNAKDTAKSEKDLIEAGRRIELLTTQFGGLAELKTFIDTYMKSTNEGLIIGKNDASSTIKVSSDRISMFSAGREVMYISQGVIHIDNGIFTASVQIGKFRTEQYHLNSDMNVIRYVG
ncbi:phage tail spike protein [Streptococcus dysgalactiae]|uniref:Tail spike domain-containing protein n=1 Tax=Streptococcus dysgalactiae subsp. dysgalactiae TaxID=99822 RepID=A0A9X7RYQ9_STRDY|nr:phage tail spike protein [Streptococcus dysgalactiae]QGH01452.1 hypothetical protein EA457_02245 [Streptococcus dysgalactiae subsp. dysgalactiae]